MSSKTCKNCKHYFSEPKEDQRVQKGKCHLMPPTLLVVEGKVKNYFPIVTEFDHCSEHDPKAEVLND